MKTPPKPRPEDVDPELNALLGAQIRTTTPEFEKRFDALRRRLANEAPRPTWQRWWDWLQAPETGALRVGALVLTLLLVAAGLVVRRHEASLATPPNTVAFIELVALEDSLAPALALADPEALDVLLHMPLN